MKRTDTITLYKEAFLNGKSDADRQAFESKSVDKQYSSIMAWKRRATIAGTLPDSKTPSMAKVTDLFKKLVKAVAELPDISAADSRKILDNCAKISHTVENFDQIKKQRRLRELLNQRSNLEREIASLQNEGVKEC